MAKAKHIYVCQACGAKASQELGRCPVCGEWGTYAEEIIQKDTQNRYIKAVGNPQKPVLMKDVICTEEMRINTGSIELNRVLGGGLVPGSLVLVGGEPGIGKSTLILQVVLHLENIKTLYVSGRGKC